jgi:hypothetical protein
MKTFEATFCVGEATLEDANQMLQMFRAENLRDINSRTGKEGETVKLLKAARIAKHAGMIARAQARAREVQLDKAGVQNNDVAKKATRAMAAEPVNPRPAKKRDRDPAQAQRRAERTARRELRKRARESRNRSDEQV